MSRCRMSEWLRRLESSAYRDALVLRGGLLIDTWIPGRRPVKDLDFLGLGSLSEAADAIEDLCSLEDSSKFAIEARETTWEETPSPGVRYQLGPEPLQIDIAVGDPLVVAPHRRLVEGVSVLCCAVEIMYGWKAHGLFERGEGRWRARDLWDLYLMQTYLALDSTTLVQAVEIAFTSRQMSFDVTERFFQKEWGCSRGSQKKWAKFCLKAGPKANVIESLVEVKEAVAERLGTILKSICPKADTKSDS